MKANWAVSITLLLVVGVAAVLLAAQQTDADRKLFDQITVAAEKGDSEAQFSLGMVVFSGELGVVQDPATAVQWWLRAADKEHVKAQSMLGACLFFGSGVTKNVSEAVRWFRKAGEKGDAIAQYQLGTCYRDGEGVTKDAVEAVKWYRKAAEQGLAVAQNQLGLCYIEGSGLVKDKGEAVKWYRKAAEQGNEKAQNNLGVCYYFGEGVAKDYVEAIKWFRKAAEMGFAAAQFKLGLCYYQGNGIVKDFVEAYKWLNLGLAQGIENPFEIPGEKGRQLAAGIKATFNSLERTMTREQIAQAQQLSREFKPRKTPGSGSAISRAGIIDSRPESSGTGFFISEEGFLVTNEHVVRDAAQVRLVTSAGFISAKVVKVDTANDLALLKAEGKFAALPVTTSRTVKLGGTVATVGFPNIGLQGFAPKFARGEIASLSGASDDPRYFQISVPVQPGNSGGALVDERGNVVGVVSAKLSARAALAASGALPENVNYAVKSSFLLGFLESVPEVSARLKEPNTAERKFESVVKSAEQAAVLVLVY